MQIIKDVYLVSGFAYGVHANVYAVKGEGGVVLVDTGTDAGELEVIDENLSYWGLTQHPLTHALITHAHFDHSGNAHILRKRGAAIAAGPGDAEGIELGDSRTIDYAFGRPFPACPVDIKVKDGDVVKAAGLEFAVFHVPGHSSGCVFYQLVKDNKTILFTGDVIRVDSNCSGAKLGWSGGEDYNLDVYLASLKRASKMKADIILAGHFQPCLKNGTKILQNAYMRALLDWRQPATYD